MTYREVDLKQDVPALVGCLSNSGLSGFRAIDASSIDSRVQLLASPFSGAPDPVANVLRVSNVQLLEADSVVCARVFEMLLGADELGFVYVSD